MIQDQVRAILIRSKIKIEKLIFKRKLRNKQFSACHVQKHLV